MDALIGADHRLRDGLAADPMKTIAAGDEVARDLRLDTVLAVTHARPLRGDVVETDCRRLVEGRRTRRAAGLHQITGDLGLAVDRDGLAGQLTEIDAVSAAAKADLDALMDETFAVQSRSDTGAFQQTDRSFFDQPGTH